VALWAELRDRGLEGLEGLTWLTRQAIAWRSCPLSLQSDATSAQRCGGIRRMILLDSQEVLAFETELFADIQERSPSKERLWMAKRLPPKTGDHSNRISILRHVCDK